MNYYLAPMEGITTYVYRNAYSRYFGSLDKYFTPFIASKKMNRRELREVMPEHNTGLTVIPQILTNKADEFLLISAQLKQLGYDTVNLNLGCPSGTVTARRRGAGFLSIPDELERFLYEIFEKSPLKISIKTRIGIESVDEWTHILEIYEKFPLDELIIHPRLQKELYKYTPHKEAFASALSRSLTYPVCYNGDITSVSQFNSLLDEIPEIKCIMLGRGILKNPFLAAQLKNPDTKKDVNLLRAFHDEIFEGYASWMSGETPTLFKMKDLWTYLSQSFENSQKHLKKIRKASGYAEYNAAVNCIFNECNIVI